MKTTLTGLLLTVVATALLAQAPPPPAVPAPGKMPPIKLAPTLINPVPPSAVTTVTNTTTGAPTRPPSTTAPEALPALPLPAGTAPATPPPPKVIAVPGGPPPGTAPGNVAGLLAARAATNAPINPAGEVMLDPTLTRLQGTPLEQVMELYSELTGRTVLRSPTVNFDQIKITLNTKTPLTTNEFLQALDSVLSLNQITVIPTGEKFLTIVPTAQQNAEGAAFNQMDAKSLPEAGQFITKIVQVKNAKPSEVVPALQPFQKSATAILPIDATGTLVLRDNAINIKRMLEVLEKIDVAVPTEEEFKVIPVNYAMAADVAQVLGGLTASGPAAGAGTTGSRTGSTSTRGRGASPFGPTGTAAIGTPGVAGQQPGVTTLGGVNPAVAQPGTAQSAFQSRLNQIVSNITGGRAGSAPLLGEAKIIPYERNNSLLVLANKTELKMLEKLLKDIDIPQQQVLIEALIFETDANHQFDMSFGMGQKTANPGAQFSGRGGINSIINFSTNTTAIGVGAATGGFGYLAQIGANWAAAITLLESDSKTEVLSRPRIQTSHAEAATIFSGGTTPYVTGSVSGVGFGTQQQIQQLQIGITLQVLPLITSDGLVVLDINQTIEGENGTVAIDANLRVPRTVRHTAQAKVAVKDSETIILGGLIRTAKTKSKSGVPVLKDIPGLGALFSTTSENPTRRELMVLIRPTVLKTPEIASRAAKDELQRSAGLRGVERTMTEEERKHIKKLEDEEIEAMRKLLKEHKRGPIPQVDPLFPAPAAAPATPEKKETTDFFEIPKTTTP
jgi:general secretion pathway protein D